MLRKWNRMLAFILAFALVVTTFSSDYANAKVYAAEDAMEIDENNNDSSNDVGDLDWDQGDDESDDYDDYDESSDDDYYEESSDDEEIPDDASAGAVDEANIDATNEGETPANETPASEDEVDASDAADAATSASTEEEADAAASASSSVEEVIVKEEVDMPAQSFYDSDNGMRVSVEAEEGAFPEGTSMKVSAISDEEAMDAAVDALGENVKQAKGVDIKFMDKAGNEIEPADAGKVHVTIKLNTDLEGDTFSVVHKDDDGSAEKVAGASAGEATFTADSFSVYILASEDDNEALLRMVETYIFKVYNSETDSWDVFNEQSVKNGETLNNPGIPTLGENQEFFGWFIDGTENQPEFGLKNDITATREVVVKAKIQSTYYVTLIGIDEEVVQVLHKSVENDAEAKVKLSVSVTPAKDTQAFIGWRNKAGVTYEYNEEIDAKDENNRTLTAQVLDAYWIHFYENDGGTGGGASYTPPVYVTSKTNYVATEPKKPTRSGYDFTGWYLDEDCNQEFDWTQPINSDKELYAGWQKGKSSFTVVIWKQSIEDDRDAANDAKTYDYEASFVVSDYNAGEAITASMLGDALTRTYEGFTYRAFDVENKDTSAQEGTISSKGTTIVNVRYDRKLITFKFYTCSVNQNNGNVYNINAYNACQEMHGLYGQPISKYNYTWPSSREWHEGKEVKELKNGWGIVTGYDLAGTGMTFLAQFSIANDQDFYSNEAQTGSYQYMHFQQNPDGRTYPSTPTNTARMEADTNVTFFFSEKYDGFSVDKYSTDNGANWHDIPAADAEGNRTVTVRNKNLYIRYKRNSYKLTIESVLEPVDAATEEPNDTTPRVEKDDISVLYGASLNGQKNSSESFAKTIAAPDGYQAKQTPDGGVLWADPAGSVPFNWSQTMPANNNTRAYIVWTKNRFTFNLDLNVDGDKNPGTTTGYDTVEVLHDQSTSWKPYYGADGANKDAIMKNFVRDGYVLVGWFNYEDDNPYDYGKVTGNVSLYAKWRRVGGVKIVYDETPGTLDDDNRDGATYAADSTVVVTSPAKPQVGYTFVGWQLLKNDDSVVGTYYPNSNFDIDESYIRTKTEGDETINYVLLKALFIETGTIDTIYTKVVYNANGGQGGTVTVDQVKGSDGTFHKIRVNEAIQAWTAADAASNGFIREGWELIGWNIDKNAADQGTVKIALGKEYIIADNQDNTDNPSTNVLYAVWKQKKATYIVKYYKGSVATSNEIPSNVAAAQANVGEEVTLSNDIVQAYKPAKGYGDGSQVDAPYVMDAEQYDNDGNIVPQVINVVYPPIKVTVTIEGNSETTNYNRSEQSVTGYTVISISNDSYTEEDFKLAEGVEAKASGTDAGTYNMNLDEDSFENINTDFTDVKFEVTDGELVINKITTTVTITGNYNSSPYNGAKHVVKGYTAEALSPLYNVDADLKYNGTEQPSAERTDFGKTDMGLTEDMFSNTNDNFEDVTFVIVDGYQDITRINATVVIKGAQNTATYDNEEHTVTGYEVVSFSTDLYTEDDFEFVKAGEVLVDNNGEPYATRKYAGKTDMKLTSDNFKNISDNFETVTFQVTDGYQEITPIDEVTVTITGAQNTTDYDGEEHFVFGYTVDISTDLYTEDDFTFKPGTKVVLDEDKRPTATRTDAGKTTMNLTSDMFVNNNENFDKVTFEVVDGYQEITRITATVTIVGNKKTLPYNGKEQKVEGYEVTNISTPLYTADDFTFTGPKDVKATEVGTVNMNLAEDQFTNENENFEDVTFVVTDGEITITPLPIKVSIIGNKDKKEFSGNEQSVTGYVVTFNDTVVASPTGNSAEDIRIPADDVKNIYKEEYIVFDYDGDGEPNTKNDAIAKGTVKGEYPMNLAKSQFENSNENFEVEFDVEDGLLEIIQREVPYSLVIKSDDVHTPYNGTEQSYTILAGVGVDDSKNPVQSTINAILNKISSFFGITASAEDGDVTFTCEGNEYVLKGAKVIATGTDVGEYAFEFIGEPEIMLGEEPVTEEFDIKYELGNLIIDKAEVTITVNSFTKGQNDADPTFTGTITGLQGEDTLELTYHRVAGDAPGTYAITPDMTKEELELEYTNYTFTIIPGTLTITGGGGGGPTPTPTPTPIPDNPTPTADAPAPVQTVLGARREEPNGQAVLGARRGGTDDSTNDTARLFAIIIAAAIAATLIITRKGKDNEEEEKNI